MELEEVTPAKYPTNLLSKDWTQAKCTFEKGGKDFLAKVHELEVRNDDIWVVTLSKCGTTWMQELVWLVVNNFDFETANNTDLEFRSPYMEFDFKLNGKLDTALSPVECLASPRLIKSHLPLPLLPAQLWTKQPKTVYVFRNPRDAIISEYYHNRSVGFNLDQTLEEWTITFMMERSTVPCALFEHVTEFYALRNEPWIYYTSFERMKLNLREIVEDMCKFLGKTITEPQMQQALHHLSFEQMKANPRTQHHWEFDQMRRKHNANYEQHNFIRKGKVNVYREEYSAELISKLDTWIEQQLAYYNLTMDELLLLDSTKD